MTMSMLPVYYTTTRTSRKRKQKNEKQIKLEADHAKFLKKMGYKGGNSSGRAVSIPNAYDSYSVFRDNKNTPAPSNAIPGGVAAKNSPQVYSGENRLIGIATMHKSCLVPVFENNKDKAKEIASMRR